MKYVMPNYDVKPLEVNDILCASKDKYEITRNEDGSANIIFNAFDIFN